MSKIKENIAVITLVERRRRRWSCSEKKAIGLETYQVGVSVSQI
jgi:hypothetical protein